MNARQLFDADDASTDSTPTDAGITRVVNFHHIKDTALWDPVSHNFTDENYVYCGRRNATYGLPESIWHNPFKGEGAIEKFRDYLLHSPHIARLEELRGKVLVCWCKPKACHCDVLVEAIEGGGNNPRRFLFGEDAAVKTQYVYDMLPPYAQRDEFERQPPSEWKHRRLVLWIAEDTDTLKALAVERMVIAAELEKAEKALTRAKQAMPRDKHAVEAAEYKVIQCRVAVNRNEQDAERVRLQLKAWKLRHMQGVIECGFENLIGDDE